MSLHEKPIESLASPSPNSLPTHSPMNSHDLQTISTISLASPSAPRLKKPVNVNRLLVMSRDHTIDPPPKACEATVREGSSGPRSRVKQTIQKLAKGVTKKLPKLSKAFRSRIPAIQNADLQDPSLNQNIEETSGPKSAGAELQGAREASEHMKTFGGRAKSVTSAAANAPAGLAAADGFQTNCLQFLKNSDSAIEKIANVHPYAKMALGVLSAAAKIILAQAKRDESVDRLLQKLDEVYGFIIRDENLSKVESMHDVIGKIAQQTLECARFIREYSETKSFCESLDYRIRTRI
ncbi:hypothetical protein C8R48DRAFT_670822 [Suillus tomentosus]|nr:hypothetical protein C8R48DRAFT_670822 [Suillus tomentosus]